MRAAIAAVALLLWAGTAAAAERLVLALGDSLTAGYQLPPGASFPAQLQAALRREGRPVVVHNAGVSGDTSAQGRARLAWVLGRLPRKPDVAIVELGANDMLRGLPVAQTRVNLDAIVNELDRRGIAVIVAGMRAAPNLGREYAAEYDAMFPAIARKYRAALYPFFLEGVAGRPELQLADGMHPNAAGVAVIVRSILPTVRRALDRLPAGSAPRP
jgi:acyl-CoA thioesterase-1